FAAEGVGISQAFSETWQGLAVRTGANSALAPLTESSGPLGSKNTGAKSVRMENCGFCAVAAADPVPSVTSSTVANEAGLIEGRINVNKINAMLQDRGLGSGTPDLQGSTAVDAHNFMRVAPAGTKFVIAYFRQGGGSGHVVNAKVSSAGLLYFD